MDIQAVRKTVARIKSNLFKNSNSYSIGMLRSHFRGSGLQFRGHQLYVPGDEVKFIDWKILAKTQIPYIKTFDEERNVEIAVVIDASTTMFAGHEGLSKLEVAIELCCLLYLLARETGDYIHAIIISDDAVTLPRSSGEAGIIGLISALQKKRILDEDGGINAGFVPRPGRKNDDKMSLLMKSLARRREIVLLSDFHDFLPPQALKKVLYSGHAHCFQITCPLDESDSIPYAFFTKRTPFSSRGQLTRVNFSGQKDLSQILGKKLKRLKVHGRYLEDFIKEML